MTESDNSDESYDSNESYETDEEYNEYIRTLTYDTRCPKCLKPTIFSNSRGNKYAVYDCGWECNKCQWGSLMDTSRWYCDDCTYDVCSDCFGIHPPNYLKQIDTILEVGTHFRGIYTRITQKKIKVKKNAIATKSKSILLNRILMKN